jgi:hypothetical protein
MSRRWAKRLPGSASKRGDALYIDLVEKATADAQAVLHAYIEPAPLQRCDRVVPESIINLWIVVPPSRQRPWRGGFLTLKSSVFFCRRGIAMLRLAEILRCPFG